jgi:hypothetical protein
MTEDTVRARKAEAFFAHGEAKERFNICLSTARVLGRELRSLGELLETNPANIEVESNRDLMDFDRLEGAVSDFLKAQTDLNSAVSEAQALGCVVT